MPSPQERLSQLWASRTTDVAPSVSESYTFDADRNTKQSLLKVGLAAAIVSCGFVWLNRPHEAEIPITMPSTTAGFNSIAPVTKQIVIDIEGKVRNPGLYHLPSDARVADAIKAAGGLLPSAARGSTNLAARLSDGQLIFISAQVVGKGGSGLPSDSGLGSSAGHGSAGAPTQISLNSATEAQFEALPGVGPVMANRIVAYRTEHGSFSSLEQLQEVPGIGPKVFANLQSYLTL